MELRATFPVARFLWAACCELPALFFLVISSRDFHIDLQLVSMSIMRWTAFHMGLLKGNSYNNKNCVKLFDVLSFFPHVMVCALHIHICIHQAVSFFSAVYHGLFPSSQLAAGVISVAYVSRWLSLNTEQRRVKCSSWRCVFLRHTRLCFSFHVCSCVNKFLALCHCRGLLATNSTLQRPLPFRDKKRRRNIRRPWWPFDGYRGAQLHLVADSAFTLKTFL